MAFPKVQFDDADPYSEVQEISEIRYPGQTIRFI